MCTPFSWPQLNFVLISVKIVTCLVSAEERVAVDDAEELLPGDAPVGMAVVLIEKIFNNQAGVTDSSPHVFQHVRLRADKISFVIAFMHTHALFQVQKRIRYTRVSSALRGVSC